MKENENDVEKAIKSVCDKINRMIYKFEKSINDKINELNKNLESYKEKIIETIKRSIKNIDDKIDNQKENNINYKDLSFNFIETLGNNLGIINAVITGGIGGGIFIASLGFNFIPGVGTVISLGIASLLTLLSFIISPSKKEQFGELIKRITEKIEDGFEEEKYRFIEIFNNIEEKLINSYQKEIGITIFQLKEEEKKEFEENKKEYNKIKEILRK